MKKRLVVTGMSAVLLAGAMLSGRTAQADPSIGYFDANYALPWHYAFDTEGTKLLEQQLYRTFGIGAFSLTLGIPYSGFNAQLDVHNALDLTALAATAGYRLRSPIILGFEVWGRLGIGPALVFDTADRKLSTTGAIATDFEAGVDWYIPFVPWLAIGVKGVFTPQLYFDPHNDYTPSFSGDLALNVGFRLAI